MKDREPTIRSRELGEGLRNAMNYAGFSGSGIARELGWSQSRISRLLAGKRGGSGFDVSAFLAVCGVKGKERDRLMVLSLDNEKPGWHQEHGRTLPKQVLTLINHEKKAVSIGDFQATLVPGMLQTSEYATALMREAGMLPEDEIDERVRLRKGRSNLFNRRPRPPRFTYFIHEFVLRLPVGGPEVMSAQLHELLRLTVRHYLTLRVVPAARGAHAAINGAFTLMEFENIKPVVYLESETSSLFLEKPVEIDAYRAILAALEDTALDEGQSRDFIERVALELYTDQEDHHDLE